MAEDPQMPDSPNPYSAPQVAATAPSTPRPSWVRPYASGHQRALWTLWLLALGIVINMSALGGGLLEFRLLSRVAAGEAISDEEATNSDLLLMSIGFTQVGVMLATAIAFLMWQHRAYRNLPSLGNQHVKYSPGWAVGYYFIPILNLFRPYQVMKEMDGGSHPENLTVAGKSKGTPLIGFWWAAWLISGFLGQAAFRIGLEAETINELLAANVVTNISDGFDVIPSVLAILLVHRIDAHQTARYASLAPSWVATDVPTA